MEPPFVFLGAPHLWTIGLTLAVPLTLSVLIRGNVGGRAARRFDWALAGILLANFVAYYAVRWPRGDLSMANDLPFHICDLAIFVAAVALLTRRQWAYELLLFWALAGTLQGVLTPDLRVDFPHPYFFVYVVNHSGVVISALYMTIGLGMRPQPGAPLRVFLISWGYFWAMLAINWLLGTNYGFLMEKPPMATVFDYLGPWPIYLISLHGLAIALFAAIYAPFWLMRSWSAAPSATVRVDRCRAVEAMAAAGRR
jgi:hypothetical integral membrane protein (TIGR02206 family)